MRINIFTCNTSITLTLYRRNCFKYYCFTLNRFEKMVEINNDISCII